VCISGTAIGQGIAAASVIDLLYYRLVVLAGLSQKVNLAKKLPERQAFSILFNNLLPMPYK
jgi:hypothetical protein